MAQCINVSTASTTRLEIISDFHFWEQSKVKSGNAFSMTPPVAMPLNKVRVS